jgi:hypothetical protein
MVKLFLQLINHHAIGGLMRAHPDRWLLICIITKGTPGSNDSLSEPYDTKEDARSAYNEYVLSLPAGYRVTKAFIYPPVGLDRDRINLKS